MARPSLDQVMLGVARCLAQRATCTKLAVGCVLTDSRGRIIGSGYNGVAHGMPHCIDTPCAGHGTPSGSNSCVAVHAEMNALINCSDPSKIRTCYTTHAPCLQCTKTLLNTDCQRLIFSNSAFEAPAKELWLSSGRFWEHLSE